ncbi:GGDEF domain-containing protein [Fodinisporobacter ferrooxydans]|uniref:GGDEF domain-containing protein n=1 Tax=Fodinisporobacter ferrooxydans TaxID=2901836 RepID=A0ABY4CSJ9_9BACL|nr:GGDEF domain-containing protein [Alicyclobacillaceae bacterium MYW30-H2]
MAISFFSAIAYASALLFFSRISLLNLIVLRTIFFFISALPVVYASYMIEVWKTSNDSKEELLVEKERLLQEKEKLVKDLELITQQMTDYTFDIQNLAVMDRLTQLYNQTYYHNRLMVEIEKSRQSKAPLSIALFDIDNFKRFNDTFGHACGDEVLKIVSSAILSKFHKRYGFAARIGGEELVIVMPETNTDDAYALAKDICDHISTLTYTFHGTTNLNMKITVSGGISTFPTMADDATSLTKCADFAMYEAKACGKNQIIRYDRINQSAILMSLATEKVDMKSTPHHIQS